MGKQECGHCGEVKADVAVRVDGSGNPECDDCYARNCWEAIQRGQFVPGLDD